MRLCVCLPELVLRSCLPPERFEFYRSLCRTVLITLPLVSYARHSPTFLPSTNSPSSYNVPSGRYLFQTPDFFSSSSNEPVRINFPFSRYHFHLPVIFPFA